MHARFEGRHRDLFDTPNRVGELLFHPVVGLLRPGVWDFGELGVSASSGEHVLPPVDVDRALAAVYPGLIAGRQPRRLTRPHVDLCSVGQLEENVHMVGDNDRGRLAGGVASVGYVDLRHGHHPVTLAQPTHHRFIGSPDVEDVESAEPLVVAPVQLAPHGREASLQPLKFYGEDLAHVAVPDHPLEHIVDPVAHGRRDQLAYQVWVSQRRLQHVPGLLRVIRHPGLGQHMFAPFQRRQGQGPVHVGPGADAHRVDTVVVEQFLPVGIGPGNVELVGDPLAGLEGAIGHRHDLTPGDPSERGNLDGTQVRACADHPDPNRLLL